MALASLMLERRWWMRTAGEGGPVALASLVPNPLILRVQISRPWAVALASLLGQLGRPRGSCLPQGRNRGQEAVSLASLHLTRAILYWDQGVALASPRFQG